jgi:hypothetical protein
MASRLNGLIPISVAGDPHPHTPERMPGSMEREYQVWERLFVIDLPRRGKGAKFRRVPVRPIEAARAGHRRAQVPT